MAKIQERVIQLGRLREAGYLKRGGEGLGKGWGGVPQVPIVHFPSSW